jgi:hypothetical protein
MQSTTDQRLHKSTTSPLTFWEGKDKGMFFVLGRELMVLYMLGKHSYH